MTTSLIFTRACIEENKIESCLNIWNVDEFSCIDTPKPHKVVTVAHKRANQLASSEKGETTTFLTFCNAAGMHTKPIVIHKGTKVMDTWQIGRPKGFSMGTSENGWITKWLFYKYGKIFIKYLTDRGLTENGKKNLLVMDSHNSHMFNFQFMKLMNNNNVVVLALPPHTTHAMQPLDDIPFANFKNEWYEVVHKFVCTSMQPRKLQSMSGSISSCYVGEKQ